MFSTSTPDVPEGWLAMPPARAPASFEAATRAEDGLSRWNGEVGCSMNRTRQPRFAISRARCDEPSRMSASNLCADANMMLRLFTVSVTVDKRQVRL